MWVRHGELGRGVRIERTRRTPEVRHEAPGELDRVGGGKVRPLGAVERSRVGVVGEVDRGHAVLGDEPASAGGERRFLRASRERSVQYAVRVMAKKTTKVSELNTMTGLI